LHETQLSCHGDYIGDDYPNQPPLNVPLVSLTTEDSEKYSLSNFDAYFDWRSTDLFPMGNRFVKLGPEGEFTVKHRAIQ
jgi:hypothetical protein